MIEAFHAVLDSGASAFSFVVACLLEFEYLREHAPAFTANLQELHELEQSAKRRLALLGCGYGVVVFGCWKLLSGDDKKRRLRLK